MLFKIINPHEDLRRVVECYWVIENESSLPRREKIIPDGFTEIIFHYGDPFRIKLDQKWKRQPRSLLAGQISKHFFLENTGVSGVFGLKFKPTALTHLFNIDMHLLADKVERLQNVIGNSLQAMERELFSASGYDEMVQVANGHLQAIISQHPMEENHADKAVDLIFAKNGMLTITEITGALNISERQLERLFKKYIGLSPKLFARIIRFNYIFKLAKEGNPEWSELIYGSGFYDQSHFIRNFKAFTGEDPSAYYFDEKNMANFFLKRVQA